MLYKKNSQCKASLQVVTQEVSQFCTCVLLSIQGEEILTKCHLLTNGNSSQSS